MIQRYLRKQNLESELLRCVTYLIGITANDISIYNIYQYRKLILTDEPILTNHSYQNLLMMTMMIKPRSTVEPHRQPWHFGPWLIQVKHLGRFFSGVTFKMPPEKWQNMPFLLNSNSSEIRNKRKSKEKRRKEKSCPTYRC